MRYAYVQDGKIIEGPMGLPKSWGNTSGFDLQTDEELRAIGWLPWRFIEVASPGPDWKSAPSVVEITATEVVETQAYVQKTQEDKDAEIASIADLNRRLRSEAYRQEADPLFFKSERGEALREEWLMKVQEIRDRYPV